jgi:hypothetical membrane protein
LVCIGLCFLIEPEYYKLVPNGFRMTLSQFGVFESTRFLFNSILITASISLVTLSLMYFKLTQVKFNFFNLLLVTTYLAVSIIGLVSYEVNYEIHMAAAVYFFLTSTFLVVEASLLKLKEYKFMPAVMSLIGLVVLVTFYIVGYSYAFIGQLVSIFINLFLFLVLIYT